MDVSRRFWIVSSLLRIVFLAAVFLRCDSATDPLEVIALQDMFKALKFSPQLEGWKVDGGDPCGESWTGILCYGSTVQKIDIHGLDLGGYLSGQLSNLQNLKHLDVSANNIEGEIPVDLPFNASHIDLSSNKFVMNIPHSLTSMAKLRHLNVSHNMLSGPIGNVFTGLRNLKDMDLSYNTFTGDLPDSFSSLKNLTRLYLQSNNFTGSVILLADLPLTDLNIQDNHFSGIIPEHFQTIPNLWIGGNHFHTEGNYPPWKFPLENVSTGQSIPGYPTAESNAIENYPPLKKLGHKKKTMGPGAIALLVGGIALLTTCTAFAIAVHINRFRLRKLGGPAIIDNSLICSPASSHREYAFPAPAPAESPQIVTVDPPQEIIPMRLPPISQFAKGRASRRSFSRKCKMPPSAKLYSLSDLQLATNNFNEENFLGEGSLGSVYRAEFPDGQVFAVKNIDTVSLSLHEEERFMDVIRSASRLRHPNIVRLTGYCIEHGRHLLLYEYVRNLTLDDALHCTYFMPLTWGLRLQIAHGIAQALDCMHSMSPPMAHCNLKATNILLDDDLIPRLCDCGLTVLRPLTSSSVKLKASEMAITNAGYVAPEQGQASTENTKIDVYAFGVLLLELLTGRRPIDSSRPEEEQCLVKWASGQLHDGNALEAMVDLGIRKSSNPRGHSLSCFAATVALCIQPEREFRPPISQVAEALAQLLPKSSTGGFEGIGFDKSSFRSTHTRFPSSPTISHLSV